MRADKNCPEIRLIRYECFSPPLSSLSNAENAGNDLVSPWLAPVVCMELEPLAGWLVWTRAMAEVNMTLPMRNRNPRSNTALTVIAEKRKARLSRVAAERAEQK
jgi:hypothetical protein